MVAILFLAHLGAVGLVWTTEAAPPLRWAAGLCLLGSFGYHVALHGVRRHPDSVVELEWGRDAGRMLLSTRDGGLVAVRVLPSSFVAPYLAVINVKRDRAWFAMHVVIVPDCLAPDAFRRLRVWLRYRGQPDAEGAGGTRSPGS